MKGLCVGIGEDCNAANAELFARFYDTTGDFAAIGDENFVDGTNVKILSGDIIPDDCVWTDSGDISEG